MIELNVQLQDILTANSLLQVETVPFVQMINKP